MTYWIVANDEAQLWSEEDVDYVSPTDEGYQAWLLAFNRPANRIGSEISLWNRIALTNPHLLPDTAEAQNVQKDFEMDKADKVLFKIAFRQENRLRALDGKNPAAKKPLTNAEFRAAIKAQL